MQDKIEIVGAREHNLKDISLSLPKNKFIVITGLSGSGKSSLAFDTLYAEGQRRYVESLSAYARQFIEMMQKPEVTSIEGLSPAIAIEQKTTSKNPRSTVGTITEIYDYLRLLFARIGIPYSPITGKPIEAQTRPQIVDKVLHLPLESRFYVLSPIVRGKKGEYRKEILDLKKQGYSRVQIDGTFYEIDEIPLLDKNKKHDISIVIDRLILNESSELKERLSGSIEMALYLSQGLVIIAMQDNSQNLLFSAKFSCPVSGFTLEEIEPRLFSFNSPFGACAACGGLGFEGGAYYSSFSRYHQRNAISSEQAEELKIDHICPKCKGYRLRDEALCVKIDEKHIGQICELSIQETFLWCQKVIHQLSDYQRQIAMRIFKEIEERLHFLITVGLDYLTLSRSSGTLSGGESQRIRLASQIGSRLTGVLYVLDEPSIGLHQRDNDRLLKTLYQLRDLGNTVLVVEHDANTILHADYVVDMGPGAGIYGGNIVAQGRPDDILSAPKSLTGAYLRKEKQIEIPNKRRDGTNQVISVKGACIHNLKCLNIDFPLGKFICVTGVSGGGKSSLVIETLYKGIYDLKNKKDPYKEIPCSAIEGGDLIDKIIDISQSPIGRTPHSNPATYTGLFTPIREWFAGLPNARARGYSPGRFSFNVKGGRCEACQGRGVVTIEMHFLPNMFIDCEVCKGRRFSRETLEILYKEKSIADVLDMSVEEATLFFSAIPSIIQKLQTLCDVGLGYIHLGQRATTLSGGEAQRIKLSKELSKRSTGKTLYILDEPTTGLHFEDIKHLLKILHKFADRGNTVIVIEHNLEVIKTADWIIDIGPEGGEKGGEIIAQGTPEEIVHIQQSYTGNYLASYL